MRLLVSGFLLCWSFAAAAAPSTDVSRLVVAGGGLVEILYALGVDDAIVAVDSSARWPQAARAKPQVGYLRALSAEGVLSLSPSLLLASDAAGPARVLRLIAAAGVPVMQLPSAHTPDAVRANIKELAALFKRRSEGHQLIDNLDASMAQAAALVASYAQHPRVLFVISAQGGLLAAGHGTAAAAMVTLAGGTNVADYNGYKPLTPEAAVIMAPDVIVSADFVVEQLGSTQALLAQPALALTPAGRDGQLLVVDAARLLSFGPQLGEAVVTFAQQLHARPAHE